MTEENKLWEFIDALKQQSNDFEDFCDCISIEEAEGCHAENCMKINIQKDYQNLGGTL